MMKYKISVIVAVYKAEKYFERCLRSLFEQTMTEIEYIFVDDCSPDNSMGVLERVAHEYPSRQPHIKSSIIQKTRASHQPEKAVLQ